MQVYNPQPGNSFSPTGIQSSTEGVRYQQLDYNNQAGPQMMPRTQWLQFPGGRPYTAPTPNSWSSSLPYELWSQATSSSSNSNEQGQRLLLTSPTHGQDSQATSYRIQDILAHGHVPLASEIAKTPGFQEKSPTGANAAIYFENRLPVGDSSAFRRKDGQPIFTDQAYQQLIIDPARQQPNQIGLPSTQVQFKVGDGCNPKSPGSGKNRMALATVQEMEGISKVTDIEKLSADRRQMSRKGRPTFSGIQIEELEKAFNQSQYLSTSDRHVLAERLRLSENQIKIWFQNRRTKCRRTAWKGRPGSGSSSNPTTPTTPNPPLTPTTPMTPNLLTASLPLPGPASLLSNTPNTLSASPPISNSVTVSNSGGQQQVTEHER